MTPSSRTRITPNRAALDTLRTNAERRKQQKRLTSTIVEIKRRFKLQKAREKVSGSFLPSLYLMAP